MIVFPHGIWLSYIAFPMDGRSLTCDSEIEIAIMRVLHDLSNYEIDWIAIIAYEILFMPACQQN